MIPNSRVVLSAILVFRIWMTVLALVLVLVVIAGIGGTTNESTDGKPIMNTGSSRSSSGGSGSNRNRNKNNNDRNSN